MAWRSAGRPAEGVYLVAPLFRAAMAACLMFSGEVLPDSLALLAQNEYEALLDEASDYANEAYYCNVDGEYELALQYIPSSDTLVFSPSLTPYGNAI